MKKKTFCDPVLESKELISKHYSSMLVNLIKVFPGSVYWKNKEGVYLGYNDSMLKLANVDELTGKSDFDLPWKDEALFIQKTDQDVIKSNKTIELEENLTLADGQCIIVSIKKTPLHDKKGNVIGILGVFIDISRQKKKIRDQATFADIVNNMPGHIYWKDKNGVYLGCNNKQALSLGFKSSSDVIGKTDFDFGLYAQNSKINMAYSFRENDLNVMESKETHIIEEVTKVRGKDVFFLSQKAPLTNELGEVIGIIGVSLDITSIKRKEEAIRRKKELAEFTLSYIIEHLPGHVYWKNKNSVFQGCNLAQAKSAGFVSTKDMIGKTDYDMPWREEADLIRESDLIVMRTKQELNREEVSRVVGSTELSTFLSRKVPFLNKEGEVIGILGISVDITDRKKAELKLNEANAKANAASNVKSEFIASMSHDLRTPLTGISIMSSNLIEKLKSSDGELEARWLHESGEQLLEFCNNVLDSVCADEYTERNLSKVCFDLSQLVEMVGVLEMPMIKSRGLDFIVKTAPDVPIYLIGDRGKLYRVLLNLLGNAIKFTEKGYVGIEVTLVEKKRGKVTLNFCVFDTGIGIKKELQKKIFERFFRADPSYKGTYEGNGLGLFIAQKYARLLGADHIHIDSEEGQGSRFSLQLSFKICSAEDVVAISPKFKQISAGITSSASMPEPPKTSESLGTDSLTDAAPLILLIEDNKPALFGLEWLITRVGCRFKAAENGEEGVALAKTNDFDLIISDIGLPGISGTEVAKIIREWEKEQHKKRVPIIALTGHAAQVAEPECLKAGMDEVVTKPATVDIINVLIKKFIVQDAINDNKNTEPATSTKQKTATSKVGLGSDLPDTEEELFALEQYPSFSRQVIEEICGANSSEIVKESLQLLSEQIPEEKADIQKAFLAKDWSRVGALAHKMKAGAAYCGTVRMHYACQYLDRYIKAGHTKLLEKLYYQLMSVADETKAYLDEWLKNNA